MTNVQDPHGTPGRALWIGSAQWAGKSAVAELVCIAHGLTVYHYGWHDSRGHRGHQGHRDARRVATGAPAPDPAPTWSDPSARPGSWRPRR